MNDIDYLRKRLDERIEIFVSSVVHLVIFVVTFAALRHFDAIHNTLLVVVMLWGCLVALHLVTGIFQFILATLRERPILNQLDQLFWYVQYVDTQPGQAGMLNVDDAFKPHLKATTITHDRQ